MSSASLRLLALAVVSVCVGQFHLVEAVDHPEIVFNELYHVVFTGSSLNRFHRCLCDVTVKSCTAEYTLKPNPTVPYYYVIDEVEAENIDQEEQPSFQNYGASYQCIPGQFAVEGQITCTRLKKNEQGCVSWTVSPSGLNVCRAFGVPMASRRCDVSCVDVQWVGFLVSYVNFRANEQPKPGSCAAASTAAPQTTTTVTTAGQIPTETTTMGASSTTSQGGVGGGGAVSMKNDDEGGGDNSLALGVGLGCAFIGIIVTVFASIVVFWRRKRKRDASLSKPNLPYIPHLHANNTYSSARPGGSGKRKISTGENGTEYAAYLEPVHIYAQVTEEDNQSGVYENIVDVERGNSTRIDGATAASNGGGVGVTSAQESSTSGYSSSNNLNTSPDPYDMAKGFENSTAENGKKKKKKNDKKGNDGKKAEKGGGGGDEDLIHDYNRLHSGRSGKGGEVSRSILARYNNPPTPPSAPDDDDDDDDSVYEGYDDDDKDKDEEEKERKSQAQQASLNAYSMAGPIEDGKVGQVSNERHVGGSNLTPPYQNLRVPAPLGVVNAAFAPDSSGTPGHEYLSLDENAMSKEGVREGNGQMSTSKSNKKDSNRAANDYFELEKES